MKQIYVWVFALIFFSACQSDQSQSSETEDKPDLKKELPGTWEMVSLRVNINSFDNRDTTVVFEIREPQWEKAYRVKPSRTYFEMDNQYRQEFRSIVDTLISENRGMWNSFGDTLMLIEPDTSYQYIVDIERGLAEFRSMVDWDGDGQEDDEYLGVHRRISRSTEE